MFNGWLADTTLSLPDRNWEFQHWKLPASRGQAPRLAVDGECPLELQLSNDLAAFCLGFYLSVQPSGSHLRVTTVVSACTEGMAQLLSQQLLNHHKLQLTVLKYVEIGVYLSTWDCKPWWFSSAAAS